LWFFLPLKADLSKAKQELAAASLLLLDPGAIELGSAQMRFVVSVYVLICCSGIQHVAPNAAIEQQQ
jgi:hypothetical protein